MTCSVFTSSFSAGEWGRSTTTPTFNNNNLLNYQFNFSMSARELSRLQLTIFISIFREQRMLKNTIPIWICPITQRELHFHLITFLTVTNACEAVNIIRSLHCVPVPYHTRTSDTQSTCIVTGV